MSHRISFSPNKGIVSGVIGTLYCGRTAAVNYGFTGIEGLDEQVFLCPKCEAEVSLVNLFKEAD